MFEKPVNQIDINGNIIKANDLNSVIKIEITDVNNNPVNLENEIEYFYLIRNNKYYPVTDISFNNEGISFKLPNLYKGLYKIEIKDKQGSIYPANDNVSILLNQSFESGKEAEFINMKDSILKDVPGIVTDYINDDPERFKGKDGRNGEDGRNGKDGKDGKDGKKGDPGEKGDPGIKGNPGEKGEKGEDGSIENINNNLIPLDINMWELGGKYESGNNWDNGISIRMIKPFKIEEGIDYTFSDRSNLDLRVSAIKAFIYKDGQLVQYVVRAYNLSRTFISEGDECIIVVDGRADRPLQLNDITNVDFKVKLEKGLIETPLIDAIHQNQIDIYKLKDGIDGVSEYIDIKTFGAKVENLDNTQSFIDAIEYCSLNNVGLLITEDYNIEGNITKLHGTNTNHNIRLSGNGSIKRGDDIHYISPYKTQKSRIYVADGHSYLNDGLTRDKPVALNTALYYLKHLGNRASQGNWEIKLIGNINQRGARNLLLDFPYFANPLVMSGERDTENNITTIIDGTGIIDNYWWYNDHGTGHQKYYIFEDLKFINWRNHSTSSGAIVVWGGSDVIIRNCEADNVGRLGWIRKGHANCSGNKVSNSYTGFTLQYHTDLNISNNTFTNIEGNAVHLGRNSAGHVNGNTFDNCYIDIEATQSSRLRTYDNEHSNWGLTAVNISLNATWEGETEDNFNTVSTLDKPNFRSFYGSIPPLIGRGSAVTTNVSEFMNPTKQYLTEGLSDDFIVPLRVPNALFTQSTFHINIKMAIVLVANSDIDLIFTKSGLPGSVNQYGEFKISSNSEYIARGMLDINIHRSNSGFVLTYSHPIPGGMTGGELIVPNLNAIMLTPEEVIHRLYFNVKSGGIYVRNIQTTVSL